MKLSTLGLFLFAAMTFLACQKEANLKEDVNKKDQKEEPEVCEWDASKVADPEAWTEYIVEPLADSSDCGCTTEGVVKYVKNGTDFAYVIYYGKGECDNWADLVTYYDEEEKTKKCKFQMDCVPDEN